MMPPHPKHRHPLRRAGLRVLASTAVVVALQASAPAAETLSPATEEALRSSTYVYISTTRKNGSLGTPAEIWFLYHQGAVYVASPPTTWRVRRIKAGRLGAQIRVGERDGPSFRATGAIVNEPDVLPVLFETFARKYPEGWKRWEERFRRGLSDGSRVLIKYTPTASPG